MIGVFREGREHTRDACRSLATTEWPTVRNRPES